jgi:hypothetical protein
MTGLSDRAMRSATVPPPSRGAPATSSPGSRWLKVSPPPLKSAPAQKARPAPVTTTARTSSSSSARSKAFTNSPRIVKVNALSRSGRFNVIVAIRSVTPYSIWEKDMHRILFGY